MKRSNLWKLLAAAVLAAVVSTAYSDDARAEFGRPTPAYVASYEPVYYHGHAHYWYGGRWFYRDHGGWRWYDREPRFLHERRGEWSRHWHRWH